MTAATRKHQARLHRDFTGNAERTKLAGAQFAAAYWDHLLGLGPEPLARAHEISEGVADAIRRQCAIEHAAKVARRHLPQSTAQAKTGSAGPDTDDAAQGAGPLLAGRAESSCESAGPAPSLKGGAQ